MVQNLVSRELSQQEHQLWDDLVKVSPQGTIFASCLWLEIINEPFSIFGCFKGSELVGGVAVVKDRIKKNIKSVVHFTPFQGIIFRDHSQMSLPKKISLEKNIIFSLLAELEKNYQDITLYNHWSLNDGRPFYWHCYGKPIQYHITLRYTSFINLRSSQDVFNNFDDDTRYEIRKAEKNEISIGKEQNFTAFDKLHNETFLRQKIERAEEDRVLIGRIFDYLSESRECQLYFARTKEGTNSAAAMIIKDNKRAYYLFGATDPKTRNNGATSLLLWKIFEELSQNGVTEIDLVGVNSPQRGRFKMGFGGQLVPYMMVQRKMTK